jgi:hypothetical protein
MTSGCSSSKESTTRRHECYWTKSYAGAHDVFYRGFREGKGIWGTWEISLFGHGGFYIWPVASGEAESEKEKKEDTAPVEAVAVGTCISWDDGN